MKENHSHPTLAIAALSATLGLACSIAQAQSMPEKVGAGRGVVNPFIENLSAAKDTVVATASRLVGSDAPATSNAAASQNVTTTPVAQASNANPPDPATPAVSGPAAVKAPNTPQMKPLAANPVKTPAVDTEGAINPLSGKSFSEEQLMRVLNANKLVTEIGRQQVEQAKNVVELSKAAGDARQIESVKQRSDAINVAPKKSIKPVKVDESLSPGEQLMQGLAGATWTGSQTNWGGVSVSGGGMASGTVQIGSENFAPQARTDANQARVVYVDTQPAKTVAGQVAGMGSSLVPAPMLSPLPPQMHR
jgi:hypothetical protein